MSIPRIIHQIWFQGKENIPMHLLDYHNSWKKYNPNYTIIIWDETSINLLLSHIETKTEFPTWITNTYRNFPLMIQKIDFAKYIILYFLGGIYIDMDVKCIKSLDSLLELHNFKDKHIILSSLTFDFLQRCIFFLSGNFTITNLINNGIIMSMPKHDILLKTMLYTHKNKDNHFKNINNFLYIFYSTGPLALSNAINSYNQTNDTKNNVAILDESYFESCHVNNVKNNNCIIPNNAIGIHYYEMSWASNNEKRLVQLYNFIQNNIITILLLIFILYFLFCNRFS
jgi:mannosyltransferase OCH1-like enzyme